MIAEKIRRELEENPRALRCCFDPIRECFTVRDTPNPSDPAISYQGIRRILKRRCFSNYDYKKSLRACPQNSGQKQNTGLQRPWHGTRRGKLVHDQIQLIVNGGERALRAAYGSQALPSDYTAKLLEALRKKGLIPVVAEFSDFYEDLRIASAIDLLCYSSKSGELCPIEIKVGGDNYFRRDSGSLQNPPSLRSFNNCPLHQAYLQLLFYRGMLVHHYPQFAIGSCYVMQIRSNGVDKFKLPQSFIDAQDELLACLASS